MPSEYEVRVGGPGFSGQYEIKEAVKDMASWLDIYLVGPPVVDLPSVETEVSERRFDEAEKLLSGFANIVIYVSGTDWPPQQPELGAS